MCGHYRIVVVADERAQILGITHQAALGAHGFCQPDCARYLLEDTRKAYGGRLHAAVFTPRAGKAHVISLRKANTREVKRHEKTTQP